MSSKLDCFVMDDTTNDFDFSDLAAFEATLEQTKSRKADHNTVQKADHNTVQQVGSHAA